MRRTSVSDGHSVAITTSPAISVDKTAPAGPYTVGQTITYSFVVTNAGNVTLHGISISDPLVGLSAITGYATTLVAGRFDDRHGDVRRDPGRCRPRLDRQHGNRPGHAAGRYAGSGHRPNTVTFSQNPALAIVKTGDVGPSTIGDTVQYTIAVSNVGNVTLHNVTSSDSKLGLSDVIPTLGVGLTATYNLSYGPVTESDLPGPIVNTATADSDETTSVSDGHSVAITTSPAITIEDNWSDDPRDELIDETNRRYSALAMLLRARYLVDVDCWSEVRGRPIKPGTICEVLRRRLAQGAPRP